MGQRAVRRQRVLIAAGVQCLRRDQRHPLSAAKHVHAHVNQNVIKPRTEGLRLLQLPLFLQCPADGGLHRVQSLFPVFQVAVRQSVKPRLIRYEIVGQLLFQDM